MKVVLEYTKNSECNALQHWKSNISMLDNFDIEYETKEVDGSHFEAIRVYYEGKVKTINALRLDLLSDFLKIYYRVK